MQLTTCDKCKEEFYIDVKEEDCGEGITKLYFICPACQEEYLVHYSTASIIRKQWKARKLQEEIRDCKGKDPARTIKLYKQFQKLKKQIGKDMEFLKRRVESR